MRSDHQRRASAPARAGRAALLLLVCASLTQAATAGAANLPAHRSCRAPLPGRAACLAMKLEVAPAQTVAPGGAAPQQRAAGANGKPWPGFLTPQRLHEAYGLPAETPDGSTQTVAVVDAYDDPTAEADLAVYDQQFGLAPCTTANGCFRKLDQEGKTSPLPPVEGGWASEISIDVQMVRAVCQSCHILLVEANSEEFADLGAAVDAAAKAGATEISNSYGGAEIHGYKELATLYYDHPGIPVLASSGDCGYLNESPFCAEEEKGALFPADSPDVVGVGGTSLTEVEGVWHSTVWKEGGSGCSTVFEAPAWQRELSGFAATGCATGRGVADVSAIGDPNTGVDVYDSTPETAGERTGWGVWGGTSVAAPIVAAEFGLAGGAEGVPYPGATLYDHAGPSSFYDVVSGTNGSCGTATICQAASGYDGPTGLGSPLGLGAFAVSGAPVSTSPPTISGVPEQGEPLAASHGGWTGSPTSFAYQWERCGFSGTGCEPIAGATGTGYTPTEADIGHAIRMRETVRNAVGQRSADSAATESVASDVPAVTSFSPASGITGSTIVVQGSAFDSTSSVQVGGLAAAFTVVSPRKLEVLVPDGLKKGKLIVTTQHGSATAKGKFAATLSITGFGPASAAPGQAVTIKGVGFDSSATVQIGGEPATVVSSSAKKLKVLVPAGAVAGPITVTNSGGVVGTVRSAGEFTP